MSSVEGSSKPSRVRWIVLALLVVAGFAAYVLRTNMSIASASLKRDLGLTEHQLGVILAAFAWGYGLFQLPGGAFGEALGARRSLALLMMSWSLLTLLCGLIPSTSAVPVVTCVTALAALRFGMGIAQAPLFPIASGITTKIWFPLAEWGLVNGLGSTALTLGAAATGPAVAWLTSELGWRQSFLILAPLGAFASALWWWFYRDDPARHKGVNREELDLIRAGQSTTDTGAIRGSWKVALLDRNVLAITASYFCMNYVFYLFFNWYYYYLVDVRQMPPLVGGYFNSAQWIVGAIAATLGGWLCDRLCTRFGARSGCRWTVAGGLIVCAPLLVAGSLVEDPTTAVALLSLSFGATQLTEGAYWAAVMRIGGRHAPAAGAVMNTGANIAGGIGALLVPVVSHYFGWAVALSTGALFALAGAVLWAWIRADVSLTS